MSIRVLIVDDSVVARKLLTQALSTESDIEVAGTAPNGRIALARIDKLSPDVVTLDIEMPGMSGLEVLTEIRRTRPKLPVIIFSSHTERASSITLEALARGASEYVIKPSNTGGLDASIQLVRDRLVPRVRALHAGARRRLNDPNRLIVRAKQTPRRKAQAVEILAIGASTGGPNALAELFAHLPADFPVPIVVTQHMPPVFTRLLAERLSAQCPLQFCEAVDGQLLEPGKVLFAPGDFHMQVVLTENQYRVAVNKAPPENSCRPAVDPMFRSVAKLFGGSALAVVLTGMGKDGLLGSRELSEQGAPIFVQDEESSVVWGMPGYIAAEGLADLVLPLKDIAFHIKRQAQRTRAKRRVS